MKHLQSITSITLALAVFACPVYAWGPKADLAIVLAAANQLMRSASVPLKSYTKELQEGASLPQQNMLELFPSMESDILTAIESEMSLLQSVSGSEMDPYYAYRLGALGRLVATATSPMRETTPTYRDLYYADVEQNIESISLTPKDRRTVNPRDYFKDVLFLSNQNNELIERAYKGGAGYQGVASASLKDHASRSVDAVTDVWHTILVAKSVSGGISSINKERYVLDGFRFYINRGNTAEITAAAKRLESVTGVNSEMRGQIAGYFYDAEMYERAIQEYESVLAQDPLNKEAQARISEYYIMQGEKSLEAGKFDDALKAFDQAAKADPLNSRGEEMRLHAQELIAMREENYSTLQETLAAANKTVDMAEAEAHNRHYAEAISLMGEAINAYNSVGDQFPDLAQEKISKVRRAAIRIEELRQGMMQNVSNFSGMGYAVDLEAMAKSLTANLERDGLQKIVKSELDKELAALEMKLAPIFVIE